MPFLVLLTNASQHGKPVDRNPDQLSNSLLQTCSMAVIAPPGSMASAALWSRVTIVAHSAPRSTTDRAGKETMTGIALVSLGSRGREVRAHAVEIGAALEHVKLFVPGGGNEQHSLDILAQKHLHPDLPVLE